MLPPTISYMQLVSRKDVYGNMTDPRRIYWTLVDVPYEADGISYPSLQKLRLELDPKAEMLLFTKLMSYICREVRRWTLCRARLEFVRNDTPFLIPFLFCISSLSPLFRVSRLLPPFYSPSNGYPQLVRLTRCLRQCQTLTDTRLRHSGIYRSCLAPHWTDHELVRQ
jgi:hypothetical protein